MTDIVTETVAEVEPPVVVQTEQPVVDPPAPEPVPEQSEPAVEPELKLEPTEAPKPAKAKEKRVPEWALERITKETQRAMTAEEQLAAERKARLDLEAALQRTSGEKPVVQSQQIAPQDIEKLVDQRASERLFFQDTTAVKNAGLAKFGSQFENDLNILNAVQATNNDVVADILAVDKANAHVILHDLAADPEKAASLIKMDSRARIVELTRMTMAKAEPVAALAPKAPPKQVSKAPAPPPPVDPSTSKTVDWRSDEVSDAEFSRGWNENMAKRAGRR